MPAKIYHVKFVTERKISANKLKTSLNPENCKIVCKNGWKFAKLFKRKTCTVAKLDKSVSKLRLKVNINV